MKSKLKKVLPKIVFKWKREVLDKFSRKTYAQDGEDILIEKIFSSQSKGFYVDVGAHHPYRFSNTFLLYRKGWSGINIDCMPNSMDIFNKKRKRDINIEAAVSDKKEKLTYYIFDEPAVNGFHSKEKIKKINYIVENKMTIETKTLNEILEEHKITHIDLLTIDVEGYDFKVLKSIDLKKYSPTAIVMEFLNSTAEEILKSKEYKYLNSEGYVFQTKGHNSSIFLKRT